MLFGNPPDQTSGELSLIKRSRALETLADNGYMIDTPIASDKAFIWAVGGDRLDIVKLLIPIGVNINIQHEFIIRVPNYILVNGSRPLHFAVFHSHLDLLILLLQNGADMQTKTFQDETALHLAAMNGHEAIAQALLKNGALVNTYGLFGPDAGSQPLQLAALGGHDGVVQILLSHGADINARKESRYLTALHIAASKGHVKVVLTLLKHNADIRMVNDKFHRYGGYTALYFAAKEGHHDVVQILLEMVLTLWIIKEDQQIVASVRLR
jgi:ankyrin repeat protein